MTIVLIIFVGIVWLLTIVLSFCIYMLYRNNEVYAYRNKIIDLIGELNKKDVANGIFDVGWRWCIFHDVSYERILYTFWKPIESFYNLKDFERKENADK